MLPIIEAPQSLSEAEKKAIAEGKLFLSCSEHNWVATFKGSHCAYCATLRRAGTYSEQQRMSKLRSASGKAKFVGVSG